MDDVSLALITAVGAGVTSSVTDATKASLVAAYNALKTRLLEKIGILYPKVSQALLELEENPNSKARKEVLVEEINATPLPNDQELIRLATTLLHNTQRSTVNNVDIGAVKYSAVSITGSAKVVNNFRKP